MKSGSLLIFFFAQYFFSFSQTINDSISKKEVKEIITYLASDEMKGRVNFSREQAIVAEFIRNRFIEYGLKPFAAFDSFYHSFPVYGFGAESKDTVYLKNVVGIIPGRFKPDEAIIFSAHYDHIDKGVMGEKSKIYNGANDDASGTTAVLLLAKYFSMRHDNERTIIFCLFAGEELGLLGSGAFAKLIKPETIKAVINIEMIGVANRTGKKAFFVTGSAYSDFKKIIERNMGGTNVKIRKEGSDYKFLFQRSDNYSFAKLGIPAHTIMCSDDNDPCYHQPCDDVGRIDMENMTKIIQAIGIAGQSIISGKETPKRIAL